MKCKHKLEMRKFIVAVCKKCGYQTRPFGVDGETTFPENEIKQKLLDEVNYALSIAECPEVKRRLMAIGALVESL